MNLDYIKIDVEEVKNLYTELSTLVYGDMDKQYKEGKIHGPDYANTWAALMQGVISGALQSVVALQSKETELDRCVKREQCAASKAKTVRDDMLAQKEACVRQEQCDASKAKTKRDDLNAEKQRDLTVRQTAGFDDNLRQKLFEAQMNAWAMMFSSGLLEAMPCFIASDEASKLYNGIIAKTMPPLFTPPPGGCKATTTPTAPTKP